MKKEKEQSAAVGTATEKRKKKKGSKSKTIGVVVLVYLAFLLAAAAVLDGRHAVVMLNGPEEMRVEVGAQYVDPGASAVSEGLVFGRSKRPLALTADRTVDTSKPGETVLSYRASVLGKTVTAQRRVVVEDTTPPVITLIESDELTSWFSGFEEPGYRAEDNVDGDLTGQVQRLEFDDRVTYSVSDAAGNETVVERPIRYSVNTPAVSLIGGSEMTIPADLFFEDPGWRAMDGLGNDLTDRVVVSGTVLPYRAGTYELRYTIENDQGDSATALRRITVVPAEQPETVYPEQPTIYLTFDDGPGPYTARLLDVLAKYDVKATFFVTDQFHGDYADLIGRAYREGHSIGVHTYTHALDWSMYQSEEAYFDDFMAMEEIIKEQTGSYTKLFRFPGGSSNTVSSFNKGIMTRLTEAMTDLGYVYFDWNVSSGDAGGTTSTARVVENVCGGVSGKSVSVVLQHDIKAFSVDAVEQIILWGQSHGYAFAALDETSFPAHHRVNN